MTLRLFKTAILLLIALMLSACGGGSGATSSSSGSTEVTVALQIPSSDKEVFKVMTSSTAALSFNNYTSRSKIPAEVVAFVFTTSGKEFDPIVVTRPVSSTLFPVKLTVPNGDNRTITIEGKNAAGTVMYLGKSTIPKLDGTPVTLPMGITYTQGLSKSYGGAKNDSATGQQTKDGGYFLAGRTQSFGAYSTSAWGVRLKSNGNVMWQKAYSPSATLVANGYSGLLFNSWSETSDNAFSVNGYIHNNGFITKTQLLAMKLDQRGNPVWTKLFAGSGGSGSMSESMSQSLTSDGGRIVSGDTDTFAGANGVDFWFLKLSADGILEWNATVGGTGSDISPSVIAVQGNPGSYVATGLANSTAVKAVAIFGFTSAGFTATPVLYTMPGVATVPRICDTSDGGFIVSSTVSGASPIVPGIWVMKFDKNLALQWQKLFEGNYTAGPVSRTADGGAIIGGNYLAGNLLAFKLDASGTIVWSRTYSKSSSNVMFNIRENSDGTITITAENTSPQGDKDVWLIKTDSSGSVSGISSATTQSSSIPSYTAAPWSGVIWATPAANLITVTSPVLTITTTNSAP